MNHWGSWIIATGHNTFTEGHIRNRHYHLYDVVNIVIEFVCMQIKMSVVRTFFNYTIYTFRLLFKFFAEERD